MNRLCREKQVAVISLLVEGASIRSTERITGVNRNTIMSLLVKVGANCQRLHDEHLRGFHSKYLQADEIWCYVQKKESRLTLEEWGDARLCDQWVFVCLDAQSKLIPA